MQKSLVLAAVLAAGWTVPALAQGLESACAGIPAAYQERCIVTVQVAHSAQPALGIAIAGGNPTAGGAGNGDGGLFGLSRLSGSVRLNVTPIHLPDITVEDDRSAPGAPPDELTVATIALGASASFGLTGGVGGVGSVDLLASGSYLPFDLIGRELYKASSAQFAWGAGARVGVLRESAAVPGLSVSLMHRRMGGVQIGNVCERDQLQDPVSTDTPPTTLCRSEGDVSDVTLGITGWSTRGIASKTLGGVGLAAGVGYDRYENEVEISVRGEQIGSGQTGGNRIYHRPGLTVESSRWSGFLDASWAVPFGTMAAEVGWMQGGDAVANFPAGSAFDPSAGTWFGSLGARIAL